jgi:hypothetical protein
MRTALVFLCLCPAALFAQKDFITADEADQIREAQDPNDRLKLYTVFARQRLDQVETLVKEHKPGGAGMIHDLIEEYNQIVDAIDTVADDALERKAEIGPGMKAVAAAEKGFLPMLESVRDSHPADIGRFEFVLEQAIDATRDSLDASGQNLGKRAEEVAERERREKKAREAVMQPKDREEQKAAEAKAANAEVNKRKKPSLLKKGETVKGQPAATAPVPQ